VSDLYIPPFWAGVICTVLVEVVAIVVAAILDNKKKK
jgi:hypothetical protein